MRPPTPTTAAGNCRLLRQSVEVLYLPWNIRCLKTRQEPDFVKFLAFKLRSCPKYTRNILLKLNMSGWKQMDF